MKIILTGFLNTMSKKQRIAGFIYLPLHVFVIPLLLGIFVDVSLSGIDDLSLNAIYYGVSFLFCVIVMYRFLRIGFDVLLDNFGRVVLSVISSYAICWVLNLAFSGALLATMGDELLNPNNEAVTNLIKDNGLGPTIAISVFLGPLVEEVLFRGVIFGSLAERHRRLAYFVSIAAFALLHTWQYALVAMDWKMLIYSVSYIPMGYAFARTYLQTNTIWAPIIMHMIMNLFSVLALQMMM